MSYGIISADRFPSLNNVILISVIWLYKFARRITAGTWLRDNIVRITCTEIRLFTLFFLDSIYYMFYKCHVQAIRLIREDWKNACAFNWCSRLAIVICRNSIVLFSSSARSDWVNNRVDIVFLIVLNNFFGIFSFREDRRRGVTIN